MTMCRQVKGSIYEPPSFYPCDRVLVQLDKLAPEGDPTEANWDKAIESVHPEGGKYDDHPDV